MHKIQTSWQVDKNNNLTKIKIKEGILFFFAIETQNTKSSEGRYKKKEGGQKPLNNHGRK